MSKYTDEWLRKVVRQNPDLTVENSELMADPVVSSPSTSAGAGDLAAKFEAAWAQQNGPKLVREWRFHEERRWRFDYAHVETKVAIELEGGVWVNGRHNRAGGFIEDASKYNTATWMGWAVFRLPAELITFDSIAAIVDYIENMDGGRTL